MFGQIDFSSNSSSSRYFSFIYMCNYITSRLLTLHPVSWFQKMEEKLFKGSLILPHSQMILLKLLQPELLFRGCLSHERALHTRSINGMSHRSSSGKKAILCGLQQSVLCFNVLHLSILLHVMEPKVCTQTSQGR